MKGGGGVVSNEPVSERRRGARRGDAGGKGIGKGKGKEKNIIIKDQEKERCDLSSRPFRASKGEAAQHIGQLKEKKRKEKIQPKDNFGIVGASSRRRIFEEAHPLQSAGRGLSAPAATPKPTIRPVIQAHLLSHTP